jgi:integrase
MADPVKTGTRPDGTTFYWFRVSAGRDPVTRKRMQVYRSFDRRKDAVREHAKVVRDVADGRLIARSGPTVDAFLDRWVPAHCRDLEAASRARITHLLRPVRERLGDRKVRSLGRADVDQLADWMLTAGRRRVGKPGTGLSPRTVKDVLAVLQLALDDAVDEHLIAANPVRRVKRPKQAAPVHELWSDEESARFGKVAAADRLAAVITLQCLGLRPEEVCGLRWRRDISLPARTLSIRTVRTLVDGRAVEKELKTAAGKRTLPLDDALVSALRAFKAVQAAEKLAAGEAYDATMDYVLCDELGAPGDPARLRRVWYRLMKQAGVPKVKPYTASRHAAASYLANRARVSPAIVAAWLGHTDAAFTMRTYVHARPEDLAAARDALAARNATERVGVQSSVQSEPASEPDGSLTQLKLRL